MKRDYYEILSISRSATEIEIKRAYRNLAKQHHPDLNPGDQAAEEKFKEASEAYEVLKDAQKRATYDQFGHDGLKNQGFQGFHNMEDVFSSFGDVFESFFGGGSRRQRHDGPRQGSDIEFVSEITLEQAYAGTKQQIEVEINQDCGTCDGKGYEPGNEPETCATCQGYGQVQQNRGFISIATTCPSCQGRGKKITHPCRTCHGKARVGKVEKVEINIPAGVDTGMHLRVPGKGHRGSQGGPAGDLYVQVHVQEHAQFARMDDHIYSTVKIGLAQASIGCNVMIETLGGRQEIEISKGAQNGDQIILKGEGLPSIRGGRAGNHYVEVKVLIPKRLSTKQEQLLREFAQESGEKVAEPSSGFLKKCKKK
ncbi:MAG: molecular chaperone DnaJ [Bdellovibrionota bacterium]